MLVWDTITLSLVDKIGGIKNEPEYIEWPQLNIKSVTTHAEMSAIIGFLRQNKIKHIDTNKKIKFPKKIYIFSFSRKKKFRLSKPCELCLKILKYYGVKKVIYSIENDVVVEKINDITDTIFSGGTIRYSKLL